MTPGRLFTIGYMEPDAEIRIAIFLTEPRTLLVDIRQTPWSRWHPQWRKAAMRERYQDRYLHLQAFGNVNYQKPNLPITLRDPEQGVAKIVPLLQSGWSVMLLCACKHYQQCHRRVVYDLLLQALQECERSTNKEAAAITAFDLC